MTEIHDAPVGGPVRELAGGVRMPVLGLGVWQLAEGREAEQAVEWALEAGYRHVDTASVYRNERSVGAALGRSGIPREEVFVTTKLLPIHRSAARELARSLERLGLDYVDLYLIHWPFPLQSARLWRELQTLQERGQARAIGVSNFGQKRLARLAAGASRQPAVDQVQFSPFHFRRGLLDHCEANGIVLEAYSPLERGRALEHPTIVGIAQRLERAPAQVMLRWAVQHNAVVIPKSARRDRIRANAQIFDFELSEDDMRTLDGLDRTSGTGRAR
jgi:diketogulonate reductase-like aldo/keto reductase